MRRKSPRSSLAPCRCLRQRGRAPARARRSRQAWTSRAARQRTAASCGQGRRAARGLWAAVAQAVCVAASLGHLDTFDDGIKDCARSGLIYGNVDLDGLDLAGDRRSGFGFVLIDDDVVDRERIENCADLLDQAKLDLEDGAGNNVAFVATKHNDRVVVVGGDL